MKPCTPPPSFQLPPDFFQALQLIHDHFTDISSILTFKLNFLASNLLRHYSTESERLQYTQKIKPPKQSMKPEEEQMELMHLRNITPEIATKIYVDTVAVLFPAASLELRSMIKKGALFVRSQTLRLWGERNMELNFGEKIFKIMRSSPKKPDKVLDLTTYDLKWLGMLGNRACFGLDSKTQKNHYKSFCIGIEKLEVARDWFEALRAASISCYISSFIEHRNKNSRSPQKMRTQDDSGVSVKGTKTLKTFKQIKEEHDRKLQENRVVKKGSQSFSENMPTAKFLDAGETKEHEKDDFAKMLQEKKEERKEQKEERKEKKEERKELGLMKSLSLTENFFHLDEGLEKKGDHSPNFKILETHPKEEIILSFDQNVRFSFDPSLLKENKPNEPLSNILRNSSDFERKLQGKRELFKLKKQPIKVEYHHPRGLTKQIMKSKRPGIFRKRLLDELKRERTAHVFLQSSESVFCDEGELFYRNRLTQEPTNKDTPIFEIRNRVKVNLTGLRDIGKFKILRQEDGMILVQHRSKKNKLRVMITILGSMRVLLHYLIEQKHIPVYNSGVLEMKSLNSFKNTPGSNNLFSLKLQLGKTKELVLIIQRSFFENEDFFCISDETIDLSVGPLICRNLFKSFLLLRKIPIPGEQNLAFDIILKDQQIIKETEVFNALVDYFTGFNHIQEYINRNLCSRISHLQADNSKFKHIYNQIEVKPLLESKFLISNLKSPSKSPYFRPRNSQNGGTSYRSKSLIIFPKIQQFLPLINQKKLPESTEKAIEILLSYVKSRKLESECVKTQRNQEIVHALKEIFKAPKEFCTAATWSSKLIKNDFLKHQRDYISKLKQQRPELLKKGLDLLSIEYPLRFYSRDSLIERLAKSLIPATFYLKSNDNQTPLQKLLSATSFCIVMLNKLLSPKVPLPVFSGDTLRVSLQDGGCIYFEVFKAQILVLLIHDQFKVSGYFTPEFKLHHNEMTLGFKASLTIMLGDRNPIKVHEVPILKSFDDTEGNRVFCYEGRCKIEDYASNLKAEICFNACEDHMVFSFSDKHSRNISEFNGWITTVGQNNSTKPTNSRRSFNKKEREREKICRIEGDIVQSLVLNNEVVWESNRQCQEDGWVEGELASDAVFGEMALLRKAGRFEMAEGRRIRQMLK